MHVGPECVSILETNKSDGSATRCALEEGAGNELFRSRAIEELVSRGDPALHTVLLIGQSHT